MNDTAAYTNSVEGRDAPSATPIPVLASSDPSLVHRLAEMAFAVMVLVLAAPLMLLIALIIRLDGPGPVLFFQKRLGKNGRPFTFVKFRTLYADARQRFPELYAYQYSHEELADLKFKIDNDPRVTRCGVWLRKSSLDELPNFWNVLTGDMALVGPRPEIPEMLRYYHGEMLMKFSVRPGVTGPGFTGAGMGSTCTLRGAADQLPSSSWACTVIITVPALR